MNTIGLETINWLLLLIIVFSAFAHGTFGFGFPLIATPMITLFFDVRIAILVTIFPTIINNVLNIVNEGKFGESAKKFSVLAFFGILGSYVGTELLIMFDPTPFRVVMGAMIILYVFVSLKKDLLGTKVLDRHLLLDISVGFVAGIIGGTVNVMLPPLLVYLSLIGVSKREMIVTLNFCFLLGKFSQAMTYGYYGYFNTEFILVVLICLLALVPGAYAGMFIRNRVDTATYKKMLNYALLAMGGYLLVQSIIELYAT